jgi:hypothetical protein
VTEIALPTVYVDETHNTGENLRDVDQPIFVLAGLYLDDELAEDIVNQVNGSRQKYAGEPKYKVLSGRPAGRAILMSALRRLPEGSARVSIVNKRYMTIVKIVDLGVEPLMFDVGYNMYADGSAEFLANSLYRIGPIIGDSDKFEQVLDAFVGLVRGGVGIDTYVTTVDNYLATVEGEARGPIEFALKTSQRGLAKMAIERRSKFHGDTLDPAIPALVSLCGSFVESLGRIRLAHDHSKVVGRNLKLLLEINEFFYLVDPDQRGLPFAEDWINSIDFVDSKSVAQLQIADWIAGAARDVGMSRTCPPRKAVRNRNGIRYLIGGVMV